MRQLSDAIDSMIESGEHTAEEIIGMMEVLKHGLIAQILGAEHDLIAQTLGAEEEDG